MSADAEGVIRFLQEARAASALNHPNILTIHEVSDHDASRYIVAEFVEGETLRQRLRRGPLTLREILDIAIQTASALAAGHTAGIVHRDVKPDNLMLRPDGYVKVLDFGVAKLAQPAPDAEDSATMAVDTALGMMVGTLAYMSPEQARGLDVDGRADGFSVGVVLYEMVAGRPPFAAATPSDLLVAILDKEPPPLRSIARGVPLQLEWIIAKALDKDPQLRYQSVADLRVDLMRLKAAIETGRIMAAAAVAAVGVAADWIGLQIGGYLPSISRELDAVDQGLARVMSNALLGASFLSVAPALGVEVFDKLLARPAVTTLIAAVGTALAADTEHQTLLAMLPSFIGNAIVGAIVVTIYRRRGLLAAGISVAVSTLLTEGMAARALDDPDLVWQSNVLFAIVAGMTALGVWGAAAAYLKRPGAAAATT